MAIKIGDKVRFLNTTGGGIVRGFNGKDQVLVWWKMKTDLRFRLGFVSV